MTESRISQELNIQVVIATAAAVQFFWRERDVSSGKLAAVSDIGGARTLSGRLNSSTPSKLPPTMDLRSP